MNKNRKKLIREKPYSVKELNRKPKYSYLSNQLHGITARMVREIADLAKLPEIKK